MFKPKPNVSPPIFTLPKTNINPEKWMVGRWSFPFGARPIYRGYAMSVSFRVPGIISSFQPPKKLLQASLELALQNCCDETDAAMPNAAILLDRRKGAGVFHRRRGGAAL